MQLDNVQHVFFYEHGEIFQTIVQSKMHELVLRGDNYVLCKPCIETECGCFVKNKLYP